MSHDINIGLMSRILMLNQGHKECATNQDALKSCEVTSWMTDKVIKRVEIFAGTFNTIWERLSRL